MELRHLFFEARGGRHPAERLTDFVLIVCKPSELIFPRGVPTFNVGVDSKARMGKFRKDISKM